MCLVTIIQSLTHIEPFSGIVGMPFRVFNRVTMLPCSQSFPLETKCSLKPQTIEVMSSSTHHWIEVIYKQMSLRRL